MIVIEEAVLQIEHIPAILYGEKRDGVYLFVHGKCGCKEEAKDFAELVCPLGWQVLGIDLPEHGSRKGETGGFDPWHAVPELRALMAYVRVHWGRVALRANSIGAWFSMLAFQGEPLEQALFVSPILDMEALICRMMQWSGVTENMLEARKTIETSFDETLNWEYFQYAKSNPVVNWTAPTAILYGSLDNLTPRQEADDFADRFNCDLTVADGAEHWFHTPEQLTVLNEWTRQHLLPALMPEEILFFAGRPEELKLYEAFRSYILTMLRNVKIKVSKTQITFSGKYGFAFVSLPRRKKDEGILVSFGLNRHEGSERIWQAAEPYPGRWTHHTLVSCREQIDRELMNWIKEAWWFANVK